MNTPAFILWLEIFFNRFKYFTAINENIFLFPTIAIFKSSNRLRIDLLFSKGQISILYFYNENKLTGNSDILRGEK